jgi:hypothetical protein
LKIDRARITRKFNLGNYETLDVGFEASLGEKDNPLDVCRQLEDLCELYLQARTAKPEAKPKPEVKAPTSPPQEPAFDAQELLGHKWKGKRTGEGSYAEGSLGWGWDFRDQFSEDVIAVLEKGPLQVGEYEFSLSENLVSAKKKKA